MKTENILNDSRLRALENHTRVNLLRPTLGTTTKNGVTCTNNGDGTYTLNGTASSETDFSLGEIKNLPNRTYKIVGCPKGGSSATYFLRTQLSLNALDFGSGAFFDSAEKIIYPHIIIKEGNTCNNLVFKPMLTTDLTATYDDFVSYEDSLQPGINTGLKMDLLWQNASPKSEFAGQTISLDLSKYKLIYIDCKIVASSDFMVSILAPKQVLNHVNQVSSMIRYRDFSVYENYINISDGYALTSVGGTETVNNSVIIPYRIYGVN